MKYSVNAHIVLVGTKYPSNIGASARALANLGGGRLILIGPQCEINSKARQGAAGAQEQLNQHEVFSDFDAFIDSKPNGYLVALSARSGDNRPSAPLGDVFQTIQDHWQGHPEVPSSSQSIFLVFGREDNGLSNSEVEACHRTALLPNFGGYSSFNLAQAVLLATYILRDKWGPAKNESAGNQDLNAAPKPATNEMMPGYLNERTLRAWLECMGVNLEAPRVNALKTLKRTLLSHFPTDKDAQVLETLFQQSIRKMNDHQN